MLSFLKCLTQFGKRLSTFLQFLLQNIQNIAIPIFLGNVNVLLCLLYKLHFLIGKYV